MEFARGETTSRLFMTMLDDALILASNPAKLTPEVRPSGQSADAVGTVARSVAYGYDRCTCETSNMMLVCAKHD